MAFIYAIATLAITVDPGVAETCPEGRSVDEFDINNEANPSLFDDLTTSELRAVEEYLYRVDDLNLRATDQVTMDSSYIYLMEALSPNKQEVLRHLDQGGPKPPRYAKAIVYRGDVSTRRIEEYKVGPLPDIRTHELLEKTGWTRRHIPYYLRSLTSPPDYANFDHFIAQQMSKVDSLVADVTGYAYNNCSERCLAWFPAIPGSFDSGDRQVWVVLMRNVQGYYLHPIGLQFRIDAIDLDRSRWTVNYVWFRSKTYTSLEEMARAKDFTKQSVRKKFYNDDINLFSSLNYRPGDDPMPAEPMRGPKSFLPDGRRYQVTGHHVDWQGWQFDFNLRSTMGLQLHDARFKGDRVVYEMTLSELAVIYSGGHASKLQTVFLDSEFLIGMESFELFKGVDCPEHATFFDFAHYFNFKPMIYKRSACLFEWSKAVPLRRHFDSTHHGDYLFWQGMPDNVLILRSFVNVYNYDYLIDFTFHQNGMIEVSCSLSGYVLGSYYTGSRDDDKFGFEFAPDNLGQIHNHLVNFKVDLDVLDSTNRFETLDVRHETVEDASEPGKTMYAQTMARHLHRTENEAAYHYNFDTPKYLIFYRQNRTNSYRNQRGYRLIPASMSKQILPRAWQLEKSFSWARYQVAVSKRKEHEEYASSSYNGGDLVNPIVDFSSYIEDDENIVDEDLVAWVTLGTWHIPRSEDVPIVQTPGVQLHFFLQPFNFLDADPSYSSRDNVRATPNKDGDGHIMEYAGVHKYVTCSLPSSLTGSANSVAVAGLCCVMSSLLLLLF